MAPSAAPFDFEEYWEDLLPFIEDRRVIAIIGAKLARSY